MKNEKRVLFLLILSAGLFLTSSCDMSANVRHDAYLVLKEPTKDLKNPTILSLRNVEDKLWAIDGKSIGRFDTLRQSERGIADGSHWRDSCVLISPGKHELFFGFKRFETDWQGNRIRYLPSNGLKKEYIFEEGHVYIFKPKVRGYNRFMSYNPYVRWEPNLLDKGAVEDLLGLEKPPQWAKEVIECINYLNTTP